ncbi:MAG: putative leader peptide [Actinomycetota bacterium]
MQQRTDGVRRASLPLTRRRAVDLCRVATCLCRCA